MGHDRVRDPARNRSLRCALRGVAGASPPRDRAVGRHRCRRHRRGRMTRRQRVVVVLVFVTFAAAAVAGLSALGSASAGPLSAALGWLGAMTGSIEHRVRERVGGPGRRARLAWAAPYRDTID